LRIFIDTNILVYSTIDTSAFYKVAKNQLFSLSEQGHTLYISSQIIREYIHAFLSVYKESKSVLYYNLNQIILNTVILFDDLKVIENFIKLLKEYNIVSKQVFDCNIVATMLSYNIDSILTHNINDFKKYEKFINLIPLI
jgi:predicted nucleic acid-binding protein